VRGVVEGFYGPPWSHEARLDLLTFIGARGMNAYVYAPKDDAKHRAQWREPYDAREQSRFRELAAHADASGIRFGFAISPGLDIAYESDADRAMLLGKLEPLHDAGVTWFLLLVDDIPMQPGLAPRQAELATWLRKQLPDARLTLCPTEYVGTHPSPYLAELAAALPSDVDVMWTGSTVCSPTITTADARAWAAALGGRAPLVWDNYPVNDGAMAHSLHLGAYRGRDPELVDVVEGVLCNPMTQPHASKVALATAAEFLLDPHGYDAAAAWSRAVADVGGDRHDALAALARACADGPLAEPDAALDLARAVDTLEDEIDGPGWTHAVAALAATFREVRDLPLAFGTGGDALASEVAPWANAARAEAQAGLAALKLVQQLRPVATIDGVSGRAAPPDAERAMHATFLMLYSWDGARTNREVVFGPRFALYPAVVQLADGSPGLDPQLAVRENGNVVDRLCRLALDAYDDWRTDAGAAVRVFVDGDERPVGADGTFDSRGAMTLVRSGRYATRVAGGDTLPFREARFGS
jgi:hyaluronoglucosaminidase